MILMGVEIFFFFNSYLGFMPFKIYPEDLIIREYQGQIKTLIQYLIVYKPNHLNLIKRDVYT